MTRRRRIRVWTCSKHDYPQQCECCENWECDECERAEWMQLGWGEYEPSAYEEFLLELMHKEKGIFNLESPLLAELTKKGSE